RSAGRVIVPVCVVEKSRLAGGCVVAAAAVIIQRERAEGRIAFNTVVEERAVTLNRVPKEIVAAIITSQLPLRRKRKQAEAEHYYRKEKIAPPIIGGSSWVTELSLIFHRSLSLPGLSS